MVQDYVDVLGPPLLLLLFLAGALVVAVALARSRMRLWASRRQRLVQQTADHAQADLELARAARLAVEAVDAVIIELGSRPATYETFPANVRELLMTAHDFVRTTPERNRILP